MVLSNIRHDLGLITQASVDCIEYHRMANVYGSRMDTTEQVNGYYFDGKSNLSEIELLFWLLMDKSYKQFGDLLDYFAWGSMILSLPLVPVRGKIDYRRATKGTSPLSLVFRKVFIGFFETRKKTLTIKSILRKD